MPQEIYGRLYFEKFFPIIPNQLYQASSIGEIRGGIKHFGVDVAIDLDGILHQPMICGIEMPWPIEDHNELPDLEVGQSIARIGARLIRKGKKVVTVCLGGENRSALMAGLIMYELDVGNGETIFQMIKDANPDGLWRKCFKEYIRSLPAR